MVLIKPEEVDTEYFGAYKGKTPKRTVHFCDGTLDEYSTDDEAEEQAQQAQIPKQEVVDLDKLTWGPWLLYKTLSAGTSTLNAVDYIGETFASIFGITSSRYYFELEEYKSRQAQSKALQEQQKGWSETNDAVVNIPLNSVTVTQPQPVDV